MSKEGKDLFKEPKVKGNSFGASGFTLGIMSIIFSGYFGTIMAVVGFVLCYIQQKNKKTKLGKAGLILNIIGFVLSLVFIFVLAPMLTKLLADTA